MVIVIVVPLGQWLGVLDEQDATNAAFTHPLRLIPTARGVLLHTFIYVPPSDMLDQMLDASPDMAAKVRPVLAALHPYGLDRSPDFEILGVSE